MTTETEIANLALQRMGASVITGILWTEDSNNATEMRVSYDHYRRAELRRNVWRFSIREQMLRPIDDTTYDVTFNAWDDATTYEKNDIVVGSDGVVYISTIASNLAHDPATDYAFAYWTDYIGSLVANTYDDTVSYMAGEMVFDTSVAAGIHTYMSITNDNEGNAVTDTDNWFEFTDDPTRTAISFIYPIGAGPASQTSTRNVFKLPHGYLRLAPQAPKQGSFMPLGAPSALSYSDWQFESDYFTSVQPGPVPFRFAADVSDPTKFDPLFIDGFSCRLAFELCERITQSNSKVQSLGGAYNKFMTEARIVNGIETGPTEAPEDTYITVRY